LVIIYRFKKQVHLSHVALVGLLKIVWKLTCQFDPLHYFKKLGALVMSGFKDGCLLLLFSFYSAVSSHIRDELHNHVLEGTK
jgi:hypothetical protein